MSWLLDNPGVVYVLLGIVALGLVTAWWMTRRAVYLICAGGVVALMILFWVLTITVVTDQQQIAQHVRAMADAVAAKKPADVLKHISRDFTFKGVKRDDLPTFIKLST